MEKKSLIPYAKQQKLKEWAGMIEARRKSGLQVKEWCEANQISERAYYYRHRLVMKMLNQIGTEHQDKAFIDQYVRENYDLSPRGIINSLDLLYVDYNAVSSYGHFGNADFPWEQ